MKHTQKKFFAILLAVALSLFLCPEAFATAPWPSAEPIGENCVVFSHLMSNESVQYTFTDQSGHPAVVGIEVISPSDQSRGLVHRVWYTSIYISAEFYMDVYNNKVTSVYDDSITIRGGSFDHETLTKTSMYGKLTFDTTTAIGGVSGKCWLKGTVTGSNDKITVDWKM
jgi:hypothetical protein